MIYQKKDKAYTLLDFYLDDSTLFDGLQIPGGMNGEYLKNLIVDTSGRLICYYQDADRFKKAIANWAAYRLEDWTRAWEAISADYNPIHNYYREELGSEEIAHHHGTKTSLNRREIESPDLTTVSDITDTPGVTTTSTGSVSAYDTSDFSPTGKNVVGTSGSSTQHSQNKQQGSNTLTAAESDNYTIVSDIDQNTFDRDVHSFDGRVTQGNIGVTRSQDMVKDEIELRFAQSIYERIAAEFEAKFLIQIY